MAPSQEPRQTHTENLSAPTHSSSLLPIIPLDVILVQKRLFESTPVLWYCLQLGGRRHRSPASAPGSGAPELTSATRNIRRTKVTAAVTSFKHITSQSKHSKNTISSMKLEMWLLFCLPLTSECPEQSLVLTYIMWSINISGNNVKNESLKKKKKNPQFIAF